MKKTIQEIRQAAILSKVFRYPEGVMSRAEWLRLMMVKGFRSEQKERRNYAAEEKLRESVEWQRKNVPLGNPFYPTTKAYLEDKARLEAGIFKTEYSLTDGKVICDITKTEFEYFNNMQLAEDINTEKMELSYKIEAGTATDQEIMEDEEREHEYFRKYT